jgi:DNA-directed RNA polymerase specialized sigma subunit
MTQREVAEAIGVTRIAIQQIENRAFEKIRKELRRRNISALDLF